MMCTEASRELVQYVRVHQRRCLSITGYAMDVGLNGYLCRVVGE